MTVCAFCGRGNQAGAQFCMDCGKPMAVQAAVPVPGPRPTQVDGTSCVFCGSLVNGHLPYCPHCGRRLTAPGSGPSCTRCASPVSAGAKFCATCGAPFAEPSVEFATATVLLSLVDDAGTVLERFAHPGPDVTIGRHEGDVRFPDDEFLSPLHAKVSIEQGRLVVRDLGSRNGTWVFLKGPHRLVDGDHLLIGSQIVRFRRLGYPGPHGPDADATKRMGSLIPSADIASLTQLRTDGSARDVIQLSPGRDVKVGRERGDWTFPYDPSMSAVHATIRSEDADFVVIDAGSRNGVALAARGAVPLPDDARILVGDKLLRIGLGGT